MPCIHQVCKLYAIIKHRPPTRSFSTLNGPGLNICEYLPLRRVSVARSPGPFFLFLKRSPLVSYAMRIEKIP